jgi:aspartate-semialdehyde dehydrogenase
MGSDRQPKVAVVGATGAVGSQIIELIAERGFPVEDLKLFATSRGAAGTVQSAGEELLVEEFSGSPALAGLDLAFLAVPEEVAREIADAAPGPLLVDLSAATRLPSAAVPMLSPGLAARERIAELRGHRRFAVPHPAAHALALCASALGPGRLAATAMLGASASGQSMIARLVKQTTDLLAARLDLGEDESQRAFNLTMRENERAIADVIAGQAAAILARSPETLSVQAVAVPVLHGSALSIQGAVKIEASDQDWIERLRAAPGVLLRDEDEPLSIIDAAGQEAIIVRAERVAAGAALWCVFDNARLAALIALWIAETFAIDLLAGN